ncbi:MAG: twitching motility protein PilT [Methanosphaera sp.]|nr:twitching motility protein PilT [Methanosphaera sp.]
MMMIQLGVDVVEELKLLLPSYYDLIVPSVVIDELVSLKKKVKGKDKIACSIALQIAQSDDFIIAYVDKTDHVDNLLLNLCTDMDVLCTNDKILRKRAKKRGITVVYLRQHRFLEVDGYVNTI